MGATPKFALPYPEATGAVMNGYDNIADLATAVETTLSGSTAYPTTRNDAAIWNVTDVVVRRIGQLVQIRGMADTIAGEALDDTNEIGNVANERVTTFTEIPLPIMQTAIGADGSGRLAGFTLVANGSGNVELTLTAVSTRHRTDTGGLGSLYPAALSFSGIYLTADPL